MHVGSGMPLPDIAKGRKEELMGKRGPMPVSVGKLAEILHGEILNSADKSNEMVENLMIGAMSIDPAPIYFNLRTNKAVITRGDRADIQLGALETPTKCLILTGGVKPITNVIQWAEEKRVPLIMVTKDTQATLAELEKGLNH